MCKIPKAKVSPSVFLLFFTALFTNFVYLKINRGNFDEEFGFSHPEAVFTYSEW